MRRKKREKIVFGKSMMPCRKYFDYFIKSFSHIFLYPRKNIKKKKERITTTIYKSFLRAFIKEKLIYGSTVQGHIDNVYSVKRVYYIRYA